ncbi:MAG TPA: hypothetical protein ENI27_10040 [bacterium]|nr:hypothetical protein [bacterium]
MTKQIDVPIIGGGMKSNDLLLPSINHLQHTGVVTMIFQVVLYLSIVGSLFFRTMPVLTR